MVMMWSEEEEEDGTFLEVVVVFMVHDCLYFLDVDVSVVWGTRV